MAHGTNAATRDELLSGLSNELSDAIDKLTTEGRVLTDEEFSRPS